MKIFFDTEFTGLHKNTSLISLGMVDENGRSFYAEFTDYDKSQVNDWLNDNVFKHCKYINNSETDIYRELRGFKDGNMIAVGNHGFIEESLRSWLSEYDDVQLVSDVCHYDMVLFIDIFGTAFDLPDSINSSCHDINQDIARYYNITEKEAFDMSREDIAGDVPGDKHNALYDAMVIREIYHKIWQEK